MAKRKETNLIIIHCADTPASMDIGAKEIEEWHKQKGYLEIGYHYVIRRNGILEPGRNEFEIGAHALGHNKDSIGVCLVGGRGARKQAEDNFTVAQKETLKDLLAGFRRSWPGIKIIGHKDVDKSRECPCFDLAKWLKDNNL